MKKWIILNLIIFLFASCSKVTQKYKDCSIEGQNRFVYEYMKDRYLWYQYMPDVDYLSYPSPEVLLNDLKYKYDRFSFIANQQELDDYFSGKGYIGFGFRLKYVDNSALLLTYVYKDSPANRANLQRGDKILKIDGVSVNNLSSNPFGESKVGVSKTFEIKKRDGTIKTITISKDIINAPSVLEKKIISYAGHNIGYLLFDKFIETSNNELDSAFSYFKNSGVDILVIDLRYNPGGYLSVANHLASLMRAENSGDEFVKIIFNDKHQNENKTYYLKSSSYSLSGINKIFFLTTSASCSASEAVINGLKPYVNTTIIGNRTCGKPIGMIGDSFCGKTLMPIEFKIFNSLNEGNYFNGLTPNCFVNDDYTHDLGEMNEAMLNEALYFIVHNSCKLVNNRMVFTKPKDNMKIFNFINAY